MNPIPYLFFNGNCKEVLNFYKQCFGGDLMLVTYADAPENEACKGAKEDEIMHGSLTNKHFAIMASDWPNQGAQPGNNIQLSINCESMDEIKDLFNALSKDGKVTQALADTFWGAHFGMLVDKFGIHWMLNYELHEHGEGCC